MIPDRDYYFEYLHQTGYDVFSRGWSMETRFDSAFGAGGTRLRNRWGANLSYAWNPNLPDSILIDVGNRVDELDEYALNNWSGGRLGHQRYVGTLFAVRNFNVLLNGQPTFDSVYSVVHGISYSGPTGDGLGWSFIVVERILSSGNNPDNTRKSFDRVVIHEMGHQRIYESEWAGHNVHTGRNQNICIMHDPGSYANDRKQQILNLRDFCQGHQQRLYNVKYWRR
jgi:hypothetical protein